jgi:hypothetical protein
MCYINTQNTIGDFDANAIAMRLMLSNDGTIKYFTGSWTPTGFNYLANEWNNFEVVHDCVNNTFDCWHNGILIIDDGAFDNPSISIRSLHFGIAPPQDQVWIDDVEISNLIQADWLSVTPDNGFLVPASNATHTININTTGLALEFYRGIITIISNDPIDPVIILKLNVTIIPLETYEINLTGGWKLISLPLQQSDESLNKVLESINGKWDIIQAYDGASQSWLSNNTYRPDSLNDLHTLDHTIGFWINITEPGVNLTVQGEILYFTEINLYTGWNLVGYPSLTEETVENALMGTGADQVMVGDTSEPYNVRDVGSTYIMKPGEGYWVHVPFDTVWIINW